MIFINKLETITNLFEGNEIRSIWDAEKEEYFFSVIDVISVLTNSDYQKSRNYWKWLKNKLISEGSEVVSNTNQLKMKASEYKAYKGLRKESLRDNMSEIEVALANIGEIATRDIAISEHPQGLNENINVAKRGGKVANDARISYEKETKKSAVSKNNKLNYQYVDTKDKLEG